MRKKETQTTHYLKSIEKNTEKISDAINHIEQNTNVIAKNSKSKLPIIALIVAAIGVYIAYLQYRESYILPSDYKVYLSSEYRKLKVYTEIDLTATLNFDTDSVTVSAYLNSVAEGDTLPMIRNNENEWHKKVYFEHIGTYEVIATAIAPNGKTIEQSLKIEVIP